MQELPIKQHFIIVLLFVLFLEYKVSIKKSFTNFKNKGVVMIDDKIQSYTIMNGISCNFLPLFVFLCEIAYLNNCPADSDVIKAKNLCFTDVTLNENEAALLFLCLLIATSFLSRVLKHGDDVWPKFTECLTNLQLSRSSICAKKSIIRGSSW